MNNMTICVKDGVNVPFGKVKVMSSIVWTTREEYLYYHCLWGQIVNYYSNATEVALWETASCFRPHAATDNVIRDGRSSRLSVTPPPYPLHGSDS